MVARYRAHATERRDCQVRLRLTPEELRSVGAAAQRAGLTTSGYAAEAAISAARGLEAPSLLPWREVISELMLTRGQLRRVGGNLNQAVRLLVIDGDAPVWLERVCELVERSVARVDEATERARRLAVRRPPA